MIAFTGDLSFTGKSSAEGGIGGFLKQAATGEGAPVMTIEGRGHAYLADAEKKFLQYLRDFLCRSDNRWLSGPDVRCFD